MRLKHLINGVLLVVLCAGLGTAVPASAQGTARTIPIPGMLLTVKTSPNGRLAAVFEVSQYHEAEDLVPDYLPVRLVDLETEGVTPLPGPADYALDVAFTPDGATLAGCYGSGQVVLWDTATGVQRQSTSLLPNIQRCAFLPDGQTLAVAFPVSTLNAFLLLDTASGAITRTLSYPFETYSQFREISSTPQTFSVFALSAFTITPDGRQIITSAQNDNLWAWDVAGAPPALLHDSTETMPNFAIRKLAVTADSATLVYLHQREPAIHVWDIPGAAETALIPLAERPHDFALAPDDDRLVLAYREGPRLELLSLSQPEAVTPLELPPVEGLGGGIPVVAFATPTRIVFTGLLAEDTGQNALFVLDVP